MIDPEKIFNIKNDEDFESSALDVFRYQAAHCKPYKKYISLLEKDPKTIEKIVDIPFLPIQFFKSEEIISDEVKASKIFTSSATTGMVPSKHYVADLAIYQRSFSEGFAIQYSDPSQYAFLALLPSYMEREGSSLVYMVDCLMKQSGNPYNGYFLYNNDDLQNRLNELKRLGQKTILIGVSFALLDFAANWKVDFPDLILIETGGMKGRGIELSREELHARLKSGFGVEKIHSEYGMAELLSQAWSKGDGIFYTPSWMKILIRDLNNPFRIIAEGKRGGINIIDLANIYSCSFIETEDMGIKEAGDGFKVSGRIKNSELRGCNLLLG